MFTKFQCFTAMSILVLSASGISWGATHKNPPAKSACRDAPPIRVLQRLQNANGPVRLVLRDHTKLTGRVVKNYSDRLTLQTLKGSEIVERTIRFNEVKKISFVEHGHPLINLIAGDAVGSGILALIILAAAGTL